MRVFSIKGRSRHKLQLENIQKKVKVGKDISDLLKDTVRYCLDSESNDKGFEISIMLVDNNKIRELNREYRNIDKSTDVLSFPIIEMKNGVMKQGIGDFDPVENLYILGDIAISMETAVKQAEEYNHSFRRELAFLVSHGVFHLLGYDHENMEDERLMLGRQEEVLTGLGLLRNEKP